MAGTSISISHQNIRSLRQNFDKFLSNYNSLLNLPDILVFSETHIYDHEVDLYNVSGYSHFPNCNNNYKCGGVSLFVKNVYPCAFSCVNTVNADFGIGLISCHGFVLNLVCVYRLHAGLIPGFISDLKLILLKFQPHNNVIIIGDININILQFPPESLDYMLTLSSCGFDCDVNEITRPTSKTCLDHVFHKFHANLQITCEVIDYYVTDHSMVLCTVFFPYVSAVPISNVSTSYEFKYIDYELLNSYLACESWHTVLAQGNPDCAFDEFLNTFLLYLSFATKVRPTTKKLKPIKPWMTQQLLYRVHLKNKLARLSRKHPTNPLLKLRARKIAILVNKEIDLHKIQFYSGRFADAKGSPKKQWRIVNDICNTNASKDIIHGIVNSNGDLLSDPLMMANEFNLLFSTIASDLVSNNLNSFNTNNTSHTEFNFASGNSFFFFPVVPEEIFFTISNLNNADHSQSFDGISNATLKKVAVNISFILSVIFNLSFEQGIFPSHLKRAVVIPLHKKGNKTILNNYRPISILSGFSKIFGKLVKQRVLNYLDKLCFFSDDQFGFREGRSTEGALARFFKFVHENFEDKKTVLALFIDLSKAFDTVNHQILLQLLNSLGFRGYSLFWFQSYLCNRLCLTKVNGVLSDERVLDIGVPQGSVLGPLFFLIYINSIFSVNFSGEVLALADDLTLLYKSDSYSNAIQLVNSDLSKLSLWLANFFMILSDKSKFMHFDRGRPITGLPLAHQGVKFHSYNCTQGMCLPGCFDIEQVTDFKYLGLTIDSGCNFKLHCASLRKYLFSVLSRLYRLRSLCPPEVLNIMYFALVQSKVSYGLPFWGCCNEVSFNPIFICQKRIIRIMDFKRARHPSWPIFVKRHILPLKHLFVFRVLRLFFSMSGNRLEKILKPYNFRRNNLCYIPKSRTTHFSKILSVIAPKIFNNLPTYVKDESTPRKFFSLVKTFLFSIQDVKCLVNSIC